jgi:hypothetical protein
MILNESLSQNRKLDILLGEVDNISNFTDLFAPRWISIRASGGVIYFQEGFHAN